MFVRYPSRPRPDHFSVHVLLVLVADVHLHAGDLLHGRVNGGELPAPAGVVEEGSVVKSVIVRAVHLGVVARGQGGHLVPVDGVIPGNTKLDLSGRNFNNDWHKRFGVEIYNLQIALKYLASTYVSLYLIDN